VTGSAAERAQPKAADPEKALAVEGIASLSAALFDTYETGVLQDMQVTCRRGPGTREARRELARGHLAAAGMQHLQDVAPRRMGEGREDGVDVVELALAP
jgi:hypothetical protein